MLPKFKALFPHIEPEFYFDDQAKDPVTYGFDVGVRGGVMSESGLVARKLAPMRFMLCATPEYVASHPQINTPSDLLIHDQIRFRISGSGSVQDWVLNSDDESVLVEKIMF